MKFKSFVKFAVVFLALFAGNARADWACQLSVIPAYWWEGTNPLYVGQSFGYQITIGNWPSVGPQPPNPSYVLSVKFYGTGISDETGEAYPGTFSPGQQYNLWGYYNPGGISGTYKRRAKVTTQYTPSGYCETNEVDVVLQ